MALRETPLSSDRPVHPASQMCKMKDVKKLRYKYIIRYQSTYKQNETTQKIEVKTSSFRGVLFGINRLMSRSHPPKLVNRLLCPPHYSTKPIERS